MIAVARVAQETMTYSVSVSMVYGEGKPRQQWNHDTTFPRGSLSVRPNDTMDDGISDAILYLNVFHNSSR